MEYISHEYTLNNVAKVKQIAGSESSGYNKYFTYDQRGRLLKVEQEIAGDSQGKIAIASYTYDELGRSKEKKLHNDSYGITYEYNVRGQLTGYTAPDLTYLVSYDELPVPAGGATAKYDGNISCFRWKNNNESFQAYTYTYDALGQLKQAAYNEQNGMAWGNMADKYNVGNLNYDLNGNIKTLTRNNGLGETLHNLVYNYNLPDNGNAIGGMVLNGNASGSYVYDLNGNLTIDGLSGYHILYNNLNLPQEISLGSEKSSYIYKASGEKLAMQAGSSLTYYRGTMVYSGDALNYIIQPEGLVRKSGNGWVYDYMLQDHLGSTRALLEASGNTLTPVQTTDYYPFGLPFATNNLNQNKYLFSGKEFQDGELGHSMLGLYDFGSRFYNPVLGRWFCQDPALQLMSPYGYCGNSPICHIDPDGESFIAFMFMGAVMNTFMQGILGNVNSEGDFWKAMGIGALAGAAGTGASLGVGSLISTSSSIGGGVIGGSLSWGAGGLARGFIGGAGMAWSNGTSFGEGLKIGGISGVIGLVSDGLSGGLIRGISDVRHGFNFWNGVGETSELLTSGVEDKLIVNAKDYNNSASAETYTELLKDRIYDEYGVNEGDWGIKRITTKVGAGYGLNKQGQYVKLKTGSIVNGYVKPTSNGSFVHISMKVAKSIDITYFRATVGHELIHAYHCSLLGGNIVQAASESVAYRYTVNEYFRGGYMGNALRTINTATSLGYWGINNPVYQIPFGLTFY